MPYTRRSGVEIYYETYGAGPPLVLIHANPFDLRLWTYQIARYAVDHRVVALDLRGYGRSEKPETAFTLRDMADDVLAVCAEEGIARAIVAGVSVGSGIAMLLGLENPALVEALILVGASSRGAGRVQDRIDGYTRDPVAYLPRHIRELVAPGFPETPLGGWLLDLFVSRAPALSGPCIAQIFRARAACELTPRLPSLAIPSLVVNGEHDASFAAGLETARLIPGARRAVIPGTGHACNLEDPTAFDEHVRAFLDAPS